MNDSTLFNLDDTEVEKPNNHIPELDLMLAVIHAAVQDARSAPADKSRLALEAMDFLISDRSTVYFYLVGIDPDIFRNLLIDNNNKEAMSAPEDEERGSRMRAIAKENKARRIFRHNLKVYKQKGFKTLIPYNMIYDYFP